MKNKKIIIILSLAILILMIMNVSASENNTCDTISTTDNIEISTTNTNEMSIKNISTKDIKTNNIENNQEKESHDSNSNDYIYNENNTINKSNIPDNTLQKSKQEILGTTNNIEILGARGELERITGISGSISQITIQFIYLFPSFSTSSGDSASVTASCDGKGGSTTVVKTVSHLQEQHVSGTITINGPFTSGTKSVQITDSSSSMLGSVTISKASTSISITGGDGYVYGSSGTKTFYKGKVNGKQGSISIAGNVAIYRNGNYWKDVSCDADGAFSVTGSSTDLDPNTYAFTCTYRGNDYYSSSNGASRSITVSKGTPTVTISRTVNTDTYPGKVSVTFTVKNQKGDALSGITLTPSGSKFSSAAGSTNGNGQVTFIVTPLDAGTYSDWKVTTTGNTKYNSVTSSSVGSFTIKKQVPKVDYVLSDINDVYPGGKKVTLTLTDRDGVWLKDFTVAASGSGFDSSNKNTDNAGSVLFSMYNLTAGTYSDWKFTVGATSNYDTVTVNLPSFIIKPYNVTVNIDDVLTPSISVYKSVITLKGSINYPIDAPTSPTGKVYAQLGNIISSGVVDSNGTFTIEFSGVKPGDYYQLNDVYFTPDASEKNYVSSTKESFNIKRILIYHGDSFVRDLSVVAKDNNFTYGNRITVTGSVRGNGRSPTGNITLYIDGNLNKVYGRDDISIGDDGQFQFVVSNAPAGNHYFTIVYEGDEYYYDSSNNTMGFTVGPADMNFESVKVSDGIYNGTGSSAYFNVTVSANGEGDIPRGQIRVNLSDNSRSWTGVLNGDNAIVYISNLGAGSYDGVTVEYLPAGDEGNYKPRVHLNTYTFNVNKGLPDFTIEAPGVGLGETAYVFIKLPSDVSGNVTLNILNGKYAGSYIFSDLAHNTTLELKDLDAGAFRITASYSGDDNWKGHDDGLADFNTTLYVERPGASINIEVDDIDYGDVALINFTIYSRGVFQSKARGSVMVYGLGSEVYEVTISNGKGFLSVPDLAMGSYNLVAYYGGYNDLMGNINTTDFKVLGHDTNMILSLNSSSMDKGSSILLTVSVADDISDPIYLYVDGQKAGVSVADNGVATFIISGHSLTTGSHNITTTLLSNDKYNGVSNNTTFIVNKIMPNYNVNVVADSNKNIIFTIYVDEGATGRITITGNGTTKKTSVDEGYAEYTLTGITPGQYTYNITYSGDDNYQQFSTIRSVNSNKLSDYSMTITNTEAASGKSPTIYVNLPLQLNGEKVYLYINNNPTPLQTLIDNGIATFKSDSITPIDGKIFVRAVYEGNDNYDAKSVNKTITVDKISQYELTINTPEIIYVGDNVSLSITCPDDISLVNLTINGLNKGEINPKAGYTISDIDEGIYNIVVSYNGDNVYYSKESNITFTSIKRTPSLNVSADSVVYGNPLVISINITDKTTGVLLVTLDDKEYKYIDITAINHNIILKDSNIKVGNHNLSVSYTGDRIYNSIKSSIYNFSISKNDTFIFDASVNENKITNGGSLTRNDEDTFLFEVNLPSDVKGNVSLIIKKSDSIIANKIINLPNNMISIPIKDFGTYNVNLTYGGDDNYNAKSIIFTLISTSSKTITNFGFDIEKSGVLYANVSNNVLYINSTNYNGPVEFYIDGVYYNNISLNNNKGNIILPALSNGNHLFTLNYGGNANYHSLTVEKTFNIVKKQSNVKIEINEGHVSELTNISIFIIDNDENLISDAAGYAFVNISGETQLIEIKNGKSTINITYTSNGTRNINVIYRGDSRYNESRNSASFDINKFNTSVTVEKSTLMFNETLIIKVNYSDATGKIKITFTDGETKTLNVSNGLAYLKELPKISKIYNAVVEYSGDYKYSPYNSIIPITINKVSTVDISLPSNVTIDNELIIHVGDNTTDGKLNVTIDDGELFSVDVVNGTAVIPVIKLPQVFGNHNIKLNYYNGSYWDDKQVNTNFYSDKVVDYNFNMTADVIRFGENATLIVDLPKDVNVDLTVKINGEDNTVKVINGHGVLENITGLHAGVNTVESEFYSDKYDLSQAYCNIQVNPNDMTLIITVPDEQLYVDDSAIISVKANVSMNNEITVYVNGKAQILRLSNGEGSFSINPLVYGDYVFTAIFDGNENYTYTVAGEKSFFVDKNNVTLNITTSDVVVGHDVEIKVNMDVDATGLVIVTINNMEYSLNITNKEYSLVIPRLTNGTYSVIAKYYGDDKYYGFENNAIVNVLKLTPTITANETLEVGDSLVIIIENSTSIVDNAFGQLEFTINNNTQIVDVVNGVAVITDLPRLNNIYSAVVKYLGDNNYYGKTQEIILRINKAPDVNISIPSNVAIDDDLIISIGDETCDGLVDVSINKGDAFSVNVVNGSAVIPHYYLPKVTGWYQISLSYYNTTYWADKKVDNVFHEDLITVYPINITVEEDGIYATITVEVPNDITKSYGILTIDNESVEVKITDGIVSYTDIFKAGNHNVDFVYEGNNKYDKYNNSIVFNKKPSELFKLNVSVEDIFVGETAILNISLPVDGDGIVLININGTKYYLETINGITSLDVNGLSYGTYNITARYLGSDLYASKTVDAILNVNKINDYELLVINSPGLDGKSCLTVFLPNDATGEVSVIINNQTFTGIVNGKSTTVDITNMVDGLNNYTLVYSGDNKYAVKRVNGTINSNGTRVDPIIIVSANDIISGETNVITVFLPDDACGNLTVKINNQDYVLSVRNMTTSIKVKFIQEGIYNVTAIYSGDVKWNSASNNTSFTVSRVDSSIKLNITDENIVAGVNFIVNVDVDVDATGNVTLNVADKKYCSVVKNGVAVFNITVESSGYYPVSAQYNGDDKYIPSQTSVVLINADKKSPVMAVEVDDINVGDNASIKIIKPDDMTGDIIIKVNNTIYEGLVVSGLSEGVYFVEVSYYGDLKYSKNTVNTTFKVSKVDNIIPNIVNNGSNVSVNLPSDAGGSVVVKINNDTYTVEVVNGTAVLPVNVSDDDNISITYSGDDKYESVSVDGSVDKGNILINPSMSIKLNNTINIGEEAILTVLLPVDATGFINVNVSGKIIAGDIVNGTATIHVCDLNSGINILQITYDGDKKYAKNSVSASVLVLKLNATFIIDVADIRVGENATVSINMPNDATGNVTLNGIVKALDNGKAVFILSGYSQGTYSINVSYDGDDKYNSAVNSTVFNVVKVSDVVCDVSANNSIVQLPEDITGNVLVTINNKTYNVVAVNGTVKLPVNLTDNDTFTVTYSGDDKYDSVSVSGKVSNNNVLLTPTLNLTKDKDSYSAGDIASINCVLPSDASGKVLYKVNGLNYTVLGTNGILLLPINASGTYNIEAIYSGDNKYDSVCKSISFSVVKINSTLNVLVEDTELHDDVIITVVAPVDAIGNITLIVDSVKYSNRIVNGTAVFNISNLAKGSYNVYAVFDGDNKYYKSENTSSFNVVNVNTPVDIKIDVVRVGENAVVRVKMPSHATGNVVLKSVGPDQYQEIGDNSTLVFTVPNLDVGKYNITVKYSGDEDYNSFEAHDVIKVTRSSFEYSINSTNQTHIFNSGVDFNAIFFDSFGDLLSNATVQFIVDGKTYNVTTDVNGSGVLNAMISVGNHKVIAVNPDTGYNLTFDLIINKRLTDNHDLVMFYNEGVWGVRVIGDDGKFVGAGVSVKFTIGKKTFTSVTNNAGWAYLKVKNIAHGKYTVKSECKGFSVYNKLTVKSLISAKKVSKVKKSKKKTKIFITLKGPKVKSKKNIKFKYSGKRKVVAKFGKALKGKKITVKFKGKTFKVKVNKKGKGTIKLTKKIAKKLKRGKKYKATASWKGFKVYKNKKITIKFKGKTYKVKTNKKSIATFKVTKKMVKKLKKGKKVKYTIIYGVDKQNRFIKIK